MKIITKNPECIWKSNNILGEGVTWVKEHNCVYFVDIKKKKILILNTKNKKKNIIKVNKEIGFLSHIKENKFILGLKDELRIVDLKLNKKINSLFIEKRKPFNRINDGKTDYAGRLWFGTMDSKERKLKNGNLYILNNNLKLKIVDKNYFITNGPAFIDNRNFFHTETSKRRIYKIKINKNFNIIKKKYL